MRIRIPIFVCVAVGLLTLLFPAARGQDKPCCSITSIDARSGTASAKVNATGQTFTFRVTDAKLISSLKVGQGVYANFGAKQVSLDGRAACCAISAMQPAQASNAPPQTAPLPSANSSGARPGGAVTTPATSGAPAGNVAAPQGSLSFSPNPVMAGMPATATLTLPALAPNGARLVISSNNSGAIFLGGQGSLTQATIPYTATQASLLGPKTLTFSIYAVHVDKQTPVAISVDYGGFKGSTVLTVQPGISGNAPPCSMSSGTTNPLTADNYGKVGAAATATCYSATCGASATISGNTFPAGTSDWLRFTVPASRLNCANPVIQVNILASDIEIRFDVLASLSGPFVTNSYDTGNSASGTQGVEVAGLGTTYTPLGPGTYYIRIYGVTPSTVGTWTLRIAG